MSKSCQASNLKKYGYDMVVATTQKSINATLKNYLYRIKSTPCTQYYGVDNTEIKASEIENVTGGIDLFRITDPEEETQKKAIQAAFDLGVGCAFRATLGISETLPPDKAGQIIELMKSDSSSSANVIYYAFFKSFEIIELEYDRKQKGAVLKHYIQEDSNPWTFKFTVRLDFSGEQFENLPEDIKKYLKAINNITNEIDPNILFSIQQLYLDLNSTVLQSKPEIVSVMDKNTKLLLEGIFKEVYFEQLEKSQGTILGYTIGIKPGAATQEALIKPTDFNFYISPYYDASGNVDVTKKDYYTLNYLVMSNDKPLPKTTGGFNWNWVEAAAEGDTEAHGCMSISEEDIVELLKQKFDPVLKCLILEPYADVDCGYVKIRYSFGLHQSYDSEELSKAVFSKADEVGEILKFSYESSAYDEDNNYIPPLAWGWGDIKIKYNVDAKINIQGNEITCTVNIVVYNHLNLEGGVSEGNVCSKTLTTHITLRTDSNGQMIFESGPMKVQDNKTDFDVSGWSEFISLGQIDDCIDTLKDMCKSAVDRACDAYDSNMKYILRNSTNWVFPGSQVFTFSNPTFSNYDDLTVQLVYIEPEDDREGRM